MLCFRICCHVTEIAAMLPNLLSCFRICCSVTAFTVTLPEFAVTLPNSLFGFLNILVSSQIFGLVFGFAVTLPDLQRCFWICSRVLWFYSRVSKFAICFWFLCTGFLMHFALAPRIRTRSNISSPITFTRTIPAFSSASYHFWRYPDELCCCIVPHLFPPHPLKWKRVRMLQSRAAVCSHKANLQYQVKMFRVLWGGGGVLVLSFTNVKQVISSDHISY